MGIFSRKKKIDLMTFTLSQAILLKCNAKDFSYKTESKILTIIYEHVKFHQIDEHYLYNGRYVTIAHALLSAVLDDAGVTNRNTTGVRAMEKAYSEAISRAYFCLELSKSIDILVNPTFVTNGHRREMILTLLRSLKAEESERLRREVEHIALFVYPVAALPFSDIPEPERQRFIAHLMSTITDSVKNNQARRCVRYSAPLSATVTTATGQQKQGILKNAELVRRIETEKGNIAGRPFPMRYVRRQPPARPQQAQQGTAAEPNQIAAPQHIRPTEPVLTPAQTEIRQQLLKDIALLDQHMEMVENLSPGESITVYEHDGEYHTPEDCENNDIPKTSGPIVLEYMSQDEYLKKCDAFKIQFSTALPMIPEYLPDPGYWLA